jgi:tripartite-type tricarboxylate transporter receptor subunit TctC
MDPDTLKRGAKLMDAHLVVVATPDIPKEEIQKWQAAYEALKADGIVNKVFKQYDIRLKDDSSL